MRILSFLGKTSVQTFLAMLAAVPVGKYAPDAVVWFLYGLGLLIKDSILLFLPFAIFVFIATSLNYFEKKGALLVVCLVFFEAISNSLASLSAYFLSLSGSSFCAVGKAGPFESPGEGFFSVAALKPWFWRVEYATLLGLAAGLASPYFAPKAWRKILNPLRSFVETIFVKIFAKIIPIFVLGSFAGLAGRGDFFGLLSRSGYVISFMLAGLSLYLFLLYFCAAGFSLKRTFLYLKNCAPAILTAFSSMSSAATMPVTIRVTKKNLKNPSFAEMLIPATANVQQIGDCFINVFLCCSILIFFGENIPSLGEFLVFLGIFVAARFTTAGFVGGAIFVMLPIYQNYLGFDEEKTALILAFNMLLDPIVTSSNVAANCALCVLFEKFWNRADFFIHGALRRRRY